ncbi:MAG: 3-oxoacyl-ACP reductase FabG [Clostridia bacterium]|nr:3-oxoacyl-ACP reductase FabG [Clostridia bacterium]
MKNVFITGASGGIGGAAAERFASAGYRVYAGYFSGRDAALRLAEKTGCIPVRADVTDAREVADAIGTIEKEGGVDILVNCAGVAEFCLFDKITDESWDRMFDVNVKGAFFTSRAAVPSMIRKKRGRIINVSSMWGITGASCEVHYSASKAALIGFTKALAKELGPSGVTVNCVAPGVIDTRMNARLSESDREALREQIPLCRIGTPADAAGAILFLASDDADYITGAVIAPDGGMTI